jgi:phospholipid/cholesterol/gamma-HCH transport system ATP-binding protein
LIGLHGLGYDIDGKTIIREVNLEIPTGETFVIMGPSGCGKSTMLRLISGLITPSRGWISINDQNVETLGHDEHGGIGMVFQSSALFDSLSVLDNVAFGLRRKKTLSEAEIRTRVQEELTRVGLPDGDLLRKMPSDLSGGMRKRVAIARTLVTHPQFILYDEPTNGLDPIMAGTINRLIRQFQVDLNVTSLVVTHDLTTARHVADRIGMLVEGELIEVASYEQIVLSKHPVIKEFMNNSVFADKANPGEGVVPCTP